MSEMMIEQVARALVDAERGTGTYDRCKSEGIWQWEIVMWEFRARTAIEAMREPTVGMLRAADSAIIPDEVLMSGPYEAIKAEYQAMIDAALKEQTK